MPNVEVIERWVTELESGKYRQVEGYLKAPLPDDPEQVGYCCLGVLCELAVEDGVIEAPARRMQPHDESEAWHYGVGTDDYAQLPRTVAAWAGLDEALPRVRWEEAGDEAAECECCREPYARYSSLAEINDEEHKTFPEIAQIIRENFLTKGNA